MKTFSLLLVASLAFLVFSCALKVTPEELQQLEDAKTLFESQIENDMHPIIWTYLDEVLHDPYSFRLQRYEYNVSSYPLITVPDPAFISGKRTKRVSAYHITMRFRTRVPAGGYMLKEMSFYLLKDKKIVLPNGLIISLIN